MVVEVFAGYAEVTFLVDNVTQPFMFQKLPMYLWLAVAVRPKGATFKLVNKEPLPGEVGVAVVNAKYKNAPLPLTPDELGNPPEWKAGDVKMDSMMRTYEAPMDVAAAPPGAGGDASADGEGPVDGEGNAQLALVPQPGNFTPGQSYRDSYRDYDPSSPGRLLNSPSAGVLSPSNVLFGSPMASQRSSSRFMSPAGTQRSTARLRLTDGLRTQSGAVAFRTTAVPATAGKAGGGKKKANAIKAGGVGGRRHSREGPVLLFELNTKAFARRKSLDTTGDPFGYGRAKMIEGEEAVNPEDREAARARAQAELDAEKAIGTSSEEELAQSAASKAAAERREQRRLEKKAAKKRGKTLDDTTIERVNAQFPGEAGALVLSLLLLVPRR